MSVADAVDVPLISHTGPNPKVSHVLHGWFPLHQGHPCLSTPAPLAQHVYAADQKWLGIHPLGASISQ